MPESTSQTVNERIRRKLGERVQYYAEHTDEIDDRLAELEREWDVERTLEANAAGLTLVSRARRDGRSAIPRDARRDRGVSPPARASGWCPPVPVFRRMGVRTQREIDAERRVLEEIQRSQ